MCVRPFRHFARHVSGDGLQLRLVDVAAQLHVSDLVDGQGLVPASLRLACARSQDVRIATRAVMGGSPDDVTLANKPTPCASGALAAQLHIRSTAQVAAVRTT